MSDYGADFLTREETIEGTWEYDGNEFPLVCNDISTEAQELLQEYVQLGAMALGADGEVDDDQLDAMNEKAESLEPLPWEEDTEHTGVVECTLEAKLEKPDVEVSEMRAPKAKAVFRGMFEAWQEGNL